MMRPLQILMPMGGLGKRFSDQGYSLPKPLIPVDGIAMFRKALSSFDSLGNGLGGASIEVITVLRRAHEDEFRLGTLIQESLPGSRVVLIEELTRGAVETCLYATPHLRPDGGLIVLDCDLWFHSPKYLECVAQCLSEPTPKLSGALTFFEASAPKYSFVRLEGDRVVQIAEKNPISSHAVIGSYFFSQTEQFIAAGQRMLKAPPQEAPEYYISSAYSQMLKTEMLFKAFRADGYHSFGTPEELKAYEQLRESSART